MPLLFSYGTLQQEEVQRATFGRLPHRPAGRAGRVRAGTGADRGSAGHRHQRQDAPSHRQAQRRSGQPRAGHASSRSRDAEIRSADQYEVAAYRRIAVQLASGAQAWVYVDARLLPPARASARVARRATASGSILGSGPAGISRRQRAARRFHGGAYGWLSLRAGALRGHRARAPRGGRLQLQHLRQERLPAPDRGEGRTSGCCPARTA